MARDISRMSLRERNNIKKWCDGWRELNWSWGQIADVLGMTKSQVRHITGHLKRSPNRRDNSRRYYETFREELGLSQRQYLARVDRARAIARRTGRSLELVRLEVGCPTYSQIRRGLHLTHAPERCEPRDQGAPQSNV